MLDTIFRARSSERDVLTDRNRLQPMIEAFDRILIDVKNERDGLCGRVAQYRNSASLVLHALDSMRTSKLEEKLNFYEAEFNRCEARLTQLAEHISKLENLRGQFVAEFSVDGEPLGNRGQS